MSNRTWFITGTSRGFGREWATAALERGDRVVGTARDLSTLDELTASYPDTFLALRLDVTDRAQVFDTVTQAHDHFGELDIVVNNAGYGHFGMVEEVTEAEARREFDTNLFGALWVTQAALPYLREQGHGHIVQISSVGGLTAHVGTTMYAASKWALEGFSQGLAKEVGQFGINITLIEPGAYDTDWSKSSASRSQTLEVYAEQHATRAKFGANLVRLDPKASSAALFRVVDAENPPLRILFGVPVAMIEKEYGERLAGWREWEPVTELSRGVVPA
jgi:NAD(P)-dependent dehydrogenase (short-subunit alcohol dehydrogenase family)